jgi:Fe2+ or Zn2+ uptake regulation protein
MLDLDDMSNSNQNEMDVSLCLRFGKVLASRGIELTKHANLVIEAVVAVAGTFSANELSKNLKDTVSRPTIFRTLAKLVEADLLQRVTFNGRDVFIVTAEDRMDTLGSI